MPSTRPGKRKAHSKSRSGCGNCKLRRVKCDEDKPSCSKCRKAHIACDYAPTAMAMQSAHEHSIDSTPQLQSQLSSNEMVLCLLNAHLSHAKTRNKAIDYDFTLGLQDLDRLSRFQERTIFSFPRRLVNIFSADPLRFLASNPYLLHAVMTCTAMHDRYFSAQSHKQRTPLESYHWATASRLFRSELADNFATSDRTAIWMAAALTSWVVLYAVETQDPEQVWPLAPSSAASGVPWFPVQKGMRTIWRMVEPSRPAFAFPDDSDLSAAAAAAGPPPPGPCINLPPPAPGVDGIPQALIDMCALDDNSTANNNPYHTAARTLSSLLSESRMPSPSSTNTSTSSLRFLAFANTTEPEFEALVRQRDPRALVLMALWYGLVPASAWWMSLRAGLERRAIFIYLSRHHAEDPRVRLCLGDANAFSDGAVW